jgi:colanic acid biosynthesis glycosyl transferase WcaI
VQRPLRVLITTQRFPPEIHPTAVMAAELAAGLARRGFAVTVATGLPHHPTGRVPEGHARAWRSTQQHGYRVVRLWHPTSESRRIPARAFVLAAQTASTAVAAAIGGRADVVLSFGGPPLLGPALSGVLAASWRAPLVTVIHDLYPDVAVEAGAVRSSILVGSARWLERLQYRLSDHLVVLGEATAATLATSHGIAPDRISVIPVWLDPEEIQPGARDNPWRREAGIAPDRFVVLYSGTAGIVSGSEVLEEVARLVDPDVDLLLVGGGSAWQALDERRSAGALAPNLRLFPYQPRERLAELQATSDLSLVTLLPGRGRTSVPSKVQGYMAAGRPVLASVDDDCDTARLVRRGGFGLVVAPCDPAAIARGIRQARGDPARLAAWGRAAREVFERDYSREPIVDRYAELLLAARSTSSKIATVSR